MEEEQAKGIITRSSRPYINETIINKTAATTVCTVRLGLEGALITLETAEETTITLIEVRIVRGSHKGSSNNLHKEFRSIKEVGMTREGRVAIRTKFNKLSRRRILPNELRSISVQMYMKLNKEKSRSSEWHICLNQRHKDYK